MKHLSVFVALVACGLFANAQLVKVSSIQQVKTPFEVDQAVISPDGTTVVASTNTDLSLMSVNLLNGKSQKIVDNGSIYQLAFTSDSRSIVYVRQDVNADKLVFKQVRSHNLLSGAETQLQAPTRDLNGVAVKGLDASVVESTKLKVKNLNNLKSYTTPVPFIRYGRLMLTNSQGKTIALNPQGEEGESYLWPSLSPDGLKVLYYHVGTGAWTCNLDGSNPRFIGDIRAPRWLDRNTVVGMNDKDNGEMFTDSEIVLSDLKGTTQKIRVQGEIPLYPSVSADGKKIACSTPSGKLYIINITK